MKKAEYCIMCVAAVGWLVTVTHDVMASWEIIVVMGMGV